tara:strand:+ start:261 stop:500 length:240 start_codon:yes stop_codon:yes gene_type:complete
MKTIKIITLLAFASLLMSAGCSTDNEEILCDCVEVRYTLPPGATTYVYHSTVAMPELNCDAENLNIHYNGSYHVKIECE